MSPKTAAAIFRIHVFVSFVIGGLAWNLAAYPGFDAIGAAAFDILDWPLDGKPGPLNETGRFMSAVAGGVLTALGVLNLMLVPPAILAGDRRILNAALASATVWVVLDSAGSVASGAAPNVAWNAVIYALYVGPLLAARRPT